FVRRLLGMGLICRISVIEDENFNSNQGAIRVEIEMYSRSRIVIYKSSKIQRSGYDAWSDNCRVTGQSEIRRMSVVSNQTDSDQRFCHTPSSSESLGANPQLMNSTRV